MRDITIALFVLCLICVDVNGWIWGSRRKTTTRTNPTNAPALPTCDFSETVYSHLRDREGFRLEGYFPTSRSGVSIAMGIDLGQQRESRLTGLGVPTSIINKLRPYLGLKSRAQVRNAGLNEADLVLTRNEACLLDRPFVNEAKNVVRSYATKMSTRGFACMVSLRHWAGALGNSKYTGKLAVRVKGGVRNFVWEAINNKRGTDATLTAALRSTLTYLTSGTAAYNRIQHEIDYMEG